MSPGIIMLDLAGAVLLVIISAAVTALVFRRRERACIAAMPGMEAGDSIEGVKALITRLAEQAADADTLSTRIDQLLANCPLPILLLDENRSLISLSNRAEQELDQPRKRRGLLETLGSHELDTAAGEAMATMRPSEITVRLYAGGRRPYRAQLLPFANGREPECLVFLQDAAQIIDYGALRSQFAANVSHELRTPLAGIRALVESLNEPEIEPEESRRFLERIDLETARLGQLIDEILFLSTLETGDISMLEGQSEARPVAEKLIGKLQPLAAERGVRMENRVPEDFTVPLPERMLTTVLGNLIENALKYSGRGSQVRIEGSREAGRTRITISDDGIGIDGEHLPHIFERFYRVDKSRSRRMGGTGLGLSIVKHVVESAGGEVAAKSREGYGTEITLMLPSGVIRTEQPD
ncbi:MAG: ATP-binding protein [Thermoleophilia bacterium]|jgi:two-component system phosphate regulon sensor histidine kinase PhoR